MAQFAAIQTVAQSLGVESRPVDLRDAGEIERAITAFAANGGMIVNRNRSVNNSSRSNHCAGGAAPITRRLLQPRLHHSRRPDFLWT